MSNCWKDKRELGFSVDKKLELFRLEESWGLG